MSNSAGGETRTLTGLPLADFESAASTIPPLRLGGGRIEQFHTDIQFFQK